MTTLEKVLFGCVVLFVLAVVGSVFARMQSGNEACRAMIRVAQTRADSLRVLTSKPASTHLTCADRLQR